MHVYLRCSSPSVVREMWASYIGARRGRMTDRLASGMGGCVWEAARGGIGCAWPVEGRAALVWYRVVSSWGVAGLAGRVHERRRVRLWCWGRLAVRAWAGVRVRPAVPS